MPTRAALFDFDGTLADSFAAITASTNFTRGRFGLPPLPEAVIRAEVGYGLPQLMAKLVPAALPDEAVAVYSAHHATVCAGLTVLYPGVAETLAKLYAMGLRMAVCSNKRVAFTKHLVEGLGLGAYFHEVLGPEDVGAPKPDPAMLLEGLRRLEVSPADAVYVGDMAVDVQAGHAAGLPVWLVPFGAAGVDDPHALGAERVLRDFAEVAELV